MGVDRSGRITAAIASLAFAAGAFPGSTVDTAAGTILGHYRIPNLQIDTYDVVTNTPWSSSYRALGTTNAVFASESVVDELCEKLGMDPIEFRLINGVCEGDLRSNGRPYERIGFLETLEAARRHPHYTSPLTGPHQGRGVASGYWGNAGGRSTASASISPDGSVSLVTGSVDITGTRMTLAMQLAETLGIAAEDVKACMGDTDSIGFADGSWGSRTTFATGWAVYELGQNLIRLLCQRAAEHWQVPAEQVGFTSGVFTVGERQLGFKELAAQLNADVPVMASAAVNPWSTGPAFATHIVDVEVDPETGGVKILRYTAVQDAGTAIHPAYVEGQMQGGTAQGIGWALNEEYIYDDAGRMLNASYLDYRIPTCSDLPPIDTVIVEVPNPGHPYGVRGVGEMSIVPPPAALANAIHAATGLRLTHLPMSPRRILEAYEADTPIP
jgi:xanthine dehydrogenase molybdenum-binding subunit